jgi:tetratricopeptide (TPR) repeat protein
VTSSQPGQKNESLQPKPFKGEVYESVDGQRRITLTSPDEAEISERGENIVCKYTKQDGKLRILVTALGTTKARYFEITTDGLQDSEGTIYFTPTRLAAAQQYNQGFCYANGQGVAEDEAEVVKWYRKVAEQGNANAQNGLAWSLATSANSALRDGAEAVAFAEKAVAATKRKTPQCLGTLAAAYAEVGQFESAVSTQQEAIALLQTEAEKNDYGSRLKLYQAKVPYHRAKD